MDEELVEYNISGIKGTKHLSEILNLIDGAFDLKYNSKKGILSFKSSFKIDYLVLEQKGLTIENSCLN